MDQVSSIPGRNSELPPIVDMGAYEFPCADVKEFCSDNDACLDPTTVCQFDCCQIQCCTQTPTPHGDVAGGTSCVGSCGPDGVVDLLDIIAVLDAFAGVTPIGCVRGNYDIVDGTGNCVRDGTVSLPDMLAVLDAFSGVSECCAGARSETFGPDEPPRNATLHFTRRKNAKATSGLIEVDVSVGAVTDLRGFEISLKAVTAGGSIDPVDVRIDVDRADFVFARQDYHIAVDVDGARAAAAMTIDGADLVKGGYLCTFVFQAAPGLTGSITLDADLGGRTRLFDSETQVIDLAAESGDSLHVR